MESTGAPSRPLKSKDVVLTEQSRTSVHQSISGVAVWVSAAEPKLSHTLHASNLSVEPPHRAERTDRLLDR